MTLEELRRLGLSAYTPGQGVASMEGGWETATGAPMYTYEDYIAGRAPYVTGATSQRPTGQEVTRTIGGVQVPVRVTDYIPSKAKLKVALQWGEPQCCRDSKDQNGVREAYRAGLFGVSLEEKDIKLMLMTRFTRAAISSRTLADSSNHALLYRNSNLPER
jgi:hypothetical protein